MPHNTDILKLFSFVSHAGDQMDLKIRVRLRQLEFAREDAQKGNVIEWKYRALQ